MAHRKYESTVSYALHQHGPMSLRQVRDATGLSESAVRDTLAMMYVGGTVQRRDVPSGSLRWVWRVT